MKFVPVKVFDVDEAGTSVVQGKRTNVLSVNEENQAVSLYSQKMVP